MVKALGYELNVSEFDAHMYFTLMISLSPQYSNEISPVKFYMLIFHVQISYYRKECTCDDTRHDRKAIRLFLISELLQVRLEVFVWAH